MVNIPDATDTQKLRVNTEMAKSGTAMVLPIMITLALACFDFLDILSASSPPPTVDANPKMTSAAALITEYYDLYCGYTPPKNAGIKHI